MYIQALLTLVSYNSMYIFGTWNSKKLKEEIVLNKGFPHEIKGNEGWQVSAYGLFLDFFPESFCSSDKISDIKLYQSTLETVELIHELLHWSGSILDLCGITEGQKFDRLLSHLSASMGQTSRKQVLLPLFQNLKREVRKS